MTHDEVYDLIVIGGGPGGYVAAIRAAQLGLKACIVEEREALGGTCLNVGCIPSKALLESSALYVKAGELGVHGIAAGTPTLDLVALMRRKERIVSELQHGLASLMRKHRIDVHKGRGRPLDGRRVQVAAAGATRALDARRAILLATGSTPVQLPGVAWDGQRIVDSTQALAFDRVPERLVVIGGGVIGLELGSVWARLGARVTVVELLPRLLPGCDTQLVALLQRQLQTQGLQIMLETRVVDTRLGADSITLVVDCKGQTQQLDADRVLVAVGRRPFTDGLGLEGLGVATGPRGHVRVGERYETTVAGIHAIGDVIEGPMLAHRAEEEGIAFAELLVGQAGHVNRAAIPSVVYTSPELAEVGLTEEAARAQGLDVRVGRHALRGNARAKTLGEPEGLVKLVADARTDRLVGAQILGPHASELIGELVLGIELSASAEDVARTCHAHPTLAEALREAALAVGARALHG